MAKIKYQVLDSKLGTHACYAKAIATGALTFDEMCEKACEDSSVEPEIMKAAVARYMKKAQEFLVLGYRIPLGVDFVTLRPVLQCSVKDVLNDDGTIKTAATADMVRANNGVSKVGATVSPKFSKLFELKTKWQKVTASGAAVDDDEEDATVTEEEAAANGGSQQSPASGGTSQNGGGTTQNNGGTTQNNGGSGSGSGTTYNLTIARSGHGSSVVKDGNGTVLTGIPHLAAGTTVVVEITPFPGQECYVKLNSSNIELTESGDKLTCTFQMPERGSVLEIHSGTDPNHGADGE